MQINLSTSPTRTLNAKFDGYCRKCNQSYTAGTPIKNEDGKWVHTTCPTKVDQVVAEVKKFVASKYQQAIFDFVQARQPGKHAVVEAKAGSGKTTTIIQSLNFTLPGDDVAFVAYNNRIVSDIERKAPNHVTVCTLHSLGRRSVVAAFPEAELDEFKLDKVMETFQELAIGKRVGQDKSIQQARRANMEKIVSLAINTMIDIDNIEMIEDMIGHYGIDLGDDHDRFVELLPRVVKKNFSMTEIYSFDDMIGMPVWLGLQMHQFDFLFVDECQDLNATQIQMVLASVKPNGKIIAVGDRNQSLYGFRGADTLAIPRLIGMLNATLFPLSITYRCPKSHVDLAKQIVPDLEAREGAIEGIIRTISEDDFASNVKIGDMIICRVNARLVGPAFALIREGIKAVIVGRDIGTGLIKLSQKLGGDTIEDATDRLLDYQRKQLDVLSRREHSENQIQSLQDTVDTLLAVYEECQTTSEVVVRINQIFSKESGQVTFSSVHRAKGLEAECVYILAPELLPMKRKNQLDWEVEQECNCQYVAYTRSKNELVFVKSTK